MARKSTPLSGVPINNPAGGQTCEISTRAIDNGFIVRKTQYGSGMDDYKSSETFSKSAPSMPKMTAMQDGAVGDERLSGAIKECKS